MLKPSRKKKVVQVRQGAAKQRRDQRVSQEAEGLEKWERAGDAFGEHLEVCNGCKDCRSNAKA